MPYANNQGIQVHYQVRGKGDSLLLVHGMFENWKTWRNHGFVEALEDTYQLIMIDVRGHNLSDKPHDPTLYDVRLLVSDLVTVLDDLDVSKAHYLGYSMGGWIGFAAAKYTPERFNSFILGGWHPYSDRPGHQPNPIPMLREQGTEGIVTWWETAALLTEELKSDLQATDVQALMALAQNGRADYRDILPRMSVPCLVYCGDADERHEGARACVQEMPDATFVSLPGHDHLGVLFHGSNKIIPHISAFLERIRLVD